MFKKSLIRSSIIIVLLAGCTQTTSTVAPVPTASTDVSAPQSSSQSNSEITIFADGIVQPVQPPLPLAFEISGKLIAVHVQPGDPVHSGDLLAQIDGTFPLDSYQAAVTSAELSVLSAREALDELGAEAVFRRANALSEIAHYAQAVRDAQFRLQNFNTPTYLRDLAIVDALEVMKSELESARDAFEPYRYLDSSNVDRQDRLDALNTAQSRFDTAVTLLKYQSDLQAAEVNLERANNAYDRYLTGPPPSELATANAAHDNAVARLNQAQDDLQKAIEGVDLVSNMEGIVWDVHAAPGSPVGNGSPIVTLLDISKMEFHTLNVSERELGQIVIGSSASITLKTFPDEAIEAEVVRIGWQAGDPIGDAATFPVILAIRETDLDIRPGMTGRVEIQITQ